MQVAGLPHNETSPNNLSRARSAIVTSSRESNTPVVLTMPSKPEADPPVITADDLRKRLSPHSVLDVMRQDRRRRGDVEPNVCTTAS